MSVSLSVCLSVSVRSQSSLQQCVSHNASAMSLTWRIYALSERLLVRRRTEPVLTVRCYTSTVQTMPWRCVCPFIPLFVSVTGRFSIKTVKNITQTALQDGPQTRVFGCQRFTIAVFSRNATKYEPASKRHLDQISRFCRSRPCDHHTGVTGLQPTLRQGMRRNSPCLSRTACSAGDTG